MSTIKIIKYKTTPESADENARLVEAVYAELAESDPGGLSYVTFRLDDGVTFVHIAEVQGDENPLMRSAAFAAFQKDIVERCVEAPNPADGTVVGSYGVLP